MNRPGCFVVCGFAIIAFVGCCAAPRSRPSGAAEAIRPSTLPATATQASVAGFVFQKHGVRLTYPAGWVAVAAEDYVLKLVPAGQTEPEVTLDVPELPPHIPGWIPLGLVVNGYTDDLKKSRPDLTITSSVAEKIPGAKAHRVTSTWPGVNGPAFDEALLMVRGDRVYIFRAAGTTGRPEASGALRSVVSSIEWTP